MGKSRLAALLRIELSNRRPKAWLWPAAAFAAPDEETELFLGPERLQTIHHEPAHQPELIAVGGK
jgi:hypothetical protein